MAEGQVRFSYGPLNRIVNVHWATPGGVFVAGADFFGTGDDSRRPFPAGMLRNSMASKRSAQDWKQVGTIDVGDWSQIRAGAYGQVGEGHGNKGSPIFVVGGIAPQFSPFLWNAFIARSSGGEVWTVTHTYEHGFVKTMAWDITKKRFLAQCTANTQADRPPFFGSNHDQIVLASPDGIAWTEIDSITNPANDYASPLLIATGNPMIKDAAGQVVPNGGYYGEDKTRGIVIAPTELDPYDFENGFVSDSNLIDVYTQDKKTGAWNKTTRALPAMTSVRCVGFAGGIWEAGGTQSTDEGNTGIIASSTDDGKTWAVVKTYPSGDIKCMMGASKSKF